jgi:diguanylate cyclase (GGDEF)-like protein
MDELIKQRFMELKAGGLLPSPKGVALAVIELTNQPNTNFQDITRMVKADPAIAGRILRYANAAHGGSMRHIVSLGQAITFLGMSRVRQIVLGFSLIDDYRCGPCPAFDYIGYWKGALAAGIAAQRLAQVARAPADESYTCGLLAGVGRLGFATAFPAAYAEILRSGLAGEALNVEENKRFGIEHVQLSAEMLDGWGLPAVFTSAVRDHELPAKSRLEPGSRSYTLCLALGLAVRIGQLLSLDDDQRWHLFPALFGAATPLDMTEEEVRALLKLVVDDWQSWANDLKLPARIHPDLSELLSDTPVGLSDHVKSGTDAVPLRFMMLVNDTERSSRLSNQLEGLGYQVTRGSGIPEYPLWSQDVPVGVVIIDTGDAQRNDIRLLRNQQGAGGRSLHIIALIPDAAKSEASRLLQEGADDYLLYGFTEAALHLRVLNARHRFSLQAADRAVRELAADSGRESDGDDRQLPSEASRDPVTHLLDRRHGLERISREWSIATRDVAPIACMVLAIDHFKQVHDQHGHDVGNTVLRQIAAIVAHCCRSSDIVFRHGEEEFCIVCPGIHEPKVRLLADRIAATVRTHEFVLPSGTLRVASRIGIAVRSPEITSPEAMIDEAVKAAKNSV